MIYRILFSWSQIFGRASSKYFAPSYAIPKRNAILKVVTNCIKEIQQIINNYLQDGLQIISSVCCMCQS